MSAEQVDRKRSSLLNVLFDPETMMLLGRGGTWTTFAEFQSNPPQRPTDLVPEPTAHNKPIDDPDPGPTYKCIGGVLYCCNGLVCTRVLRNGHPVPCP
jgi:hypothetical protein